VLGHLGRVHLRDLALDLADVLRPTRAHLEVLKSRSGFNASEMIAAASGHDTINTRARNADEPGGCALGRCSARFSS
jgi:hypothetical protein